jgi:hypothetical protein
VFLYTEARKVLVLMGFDFSLFRLYFHIYLGAFVNLSLSIHSDHA